MSDQDPPDSPPANSSPTAQKNQDYWRKNLRIVGVLLVIWATVSCGFGILLVDSLNTVRIPGTGFKLGFWFAQQGSIYVFVILIAIYVWVMNKLDREYGVADDE